MAEVESVQEYQAALSMARDIALKDGVPNYKSGGRRYDPELGLNMVFYNKAVEDVRKTKLGYHFVYSSTVLGTDGKYDPSTKLLEEDGTPQVMDCDCEEENQIRGKASTLARVISERTRQGLHFKPGAPVYVDQVWIRVIIPGQQADNVFDTQAIIIGDNEVADTHETGEFTREAAHNLRWPRHWEEYKRRQNKRIEGAGLIGTPLRELAKEAVGVLKPSQVMSFEHAGIKTVEQFLATPDGVGQKFMGWSTTKRAVQDWADQHAADAPMQLMQELEERHSAERRADKDTIDELKATMARLQAKVMGEESVGIVSASPPVGQPPKRRGRPPKTAVAE